MSRLRAIPVIVHGQSSGRLTDAELVRFENVLDSADYAVEACMHARTKVRVPSTEHETTGVLMALVKTIGASTGATEPVSLTSQRELVAWAHAAISEKSARDVRVATSNGMKEVMDKALLSQSLEVISRLTARYESCA